MPAAVENNRSLAEVIVEVKGEIKDFAQTRFDMLRSELQERRRTWKTALPTIAVGVVLLATAWFVLTAALIAVLAAAFYPSRFAYFFSCLIVGLLYAIAGAIMAGLAVRTLKERGLVPQRTIKVLREDAAWMQTEARSHV
jgi:VIT1/CCC1 family predicted Fe2+/Mn2+ transporter